MTQKKLQFLRIAIIAYIIIAAILWCLSFREIFSQITDEGDMARASNLANTIYYLAVWLLAVIIVARARLNTGNLLFASLIVGNSISPVISVIFDGWAYNIAAGIHNMLFYCLLFKTFQYFPKPVTREDICHKIRWKPIRQIMLWVHHDKSWFIFPLIALGIMFTPFQMVLFIVLLLVVMTYLYINLSTSKSSDRNKVLWLFWGIDIYFVCVILDILFSAFSNDDMQFISNLLSIVSVAALLLALTMSFFFFDTFDTGFIVKRTILNSFMLVGIIFVYNVIEHYFLHWVSHRLHLSDALVSSILSGILVMVFSPMHHKLMHFFEKRLKAGNSHKSQ